MGIFKLRILCIAFGDVFKLFLMYLPGITGIRLRRWYYRKHFRSCGKNLIIDVGVSIEGAEYISVGDNVFIDKHVILSTDSVTVGNVTEKRNSDFSHTRGALVIGNDVHLCQGCIVMAYGGVEISDNCVLSASAKIYSLTNTAYDPQEKSKVISIQPYRQAPFLLSPVVLKRNTWLGLHVIVMPGVTIGCDSFAASNSVLMKRCPPNSYLVGQPAVVIKNRFQDENLL